MRFICLVILLHLITGCKLQSQDTTAKQVSEDITKHCGKEVAAELNRGKGPLTWSQIADHVASGDHHWLKTAAALKPYTDAGNSESLENAVADALPKAPDQVLGVWGPFRADHVCTGAQFIEVKNGYVRVERTDKRASCSGRSTWRATTTAYFSPREGIDERRNLGTDYEQLSQGASQDTAHPDRRRPNRR